MIRKAVPPMARPTTRFSKTQIYGSIAIVLVAVVGVIIWTIVDGNKDKDDASANSPAVVNSGSPSSSPSASEGSASKSPTLSADGKKQDVTLGDWRPTARGFAEAWANPDGGKDAWLGRMKPMLTDEMYNRFKNTNENQIEDLNYEGLSVYSENENEEIIDISYEGQRDYMRIALTPAGEDWKVAYVTQP